MAQPRAPVRQVIIDNTFAYRLSAEGLGALAKLGAEQLLVRPLHFWQNGNTERSNRTL